MIVLSKQEKGKVVVIEYIDDKGVHHWKFMVKGEEHI